MPRFTISDSLPAETPFYYYDLDLLDKTLDKAIEAADKYGSKIHFAVKANSETEILKRISAKGIGADCVSGWEIEKCLECGFPADKIVFAGVGKTDREILYALENRIFMFNVESIEELEVLDSLAREKGVRAEIALRINPDIAPDTNHLISTGHSDSKFGITRGELDKAVLSVKRCKNLYLKGIHIHIGSQITDMRFFEYQGRNAAKYLHDLRSMGCDIRIADMGGGLGIDYEDPDRNPIPDFQGYFAALDRNLHGEEVHVELGRALVAQCGELITKVLFTKNAGEGKKYIIVNAGMNNLIRPALYGARHRVENLSATGRSESMYSIGGPICESSDIFADGIMFPESTRGDILTIRSTGAYGSIMSSHYNLRPTAASVYQNESDGMLLKKNR